MYTYYSDDPMKAMDVDFNIRMKVKDFDNEAYNFLVGDTMTFIYAIFVLFTGSLSDFIDRKLLLCVATFGWTLCTYMSSFCTNFQQLLTLKIIMNFFSAFQGPCSYSLLTDWIRPQERTMAYALYALGVQFGQPLQAYNFDLVDYLGWEAAYQFLALISFMVLVLSFLTFDEPERGRFDIAHSVIANDSLRERSVAKNPQDHGYAMSERTGQKLDIARDPEYSINMNKETFLTSYWKSLIAMFNNDTARWILLAACLRT